jgi:cell wall-associated NlpC family hydrolase
MFHPSIIAAAATHAKRDYPKEAGGLVLAGRYQAFANIARDPARAFQLPADAWPLSGRVDAVIHSHVAPPAHHLHSVDPRAPSAADIAGQQTTGVPWGIHWTDGKRVSEPIWFGDHLLAEPLFQASMHGNWENHVQRPFLHGVRDCLTLARAWFYQKRGIIIPDVPRDPEFWTDGRDLFGEHFAQLGFRRIERGAIGEEGDVVLFRFLRSVAFPHHCGIVLKGRQLLHHPRDRLSIIDPLGRLEAHALYGLRWAGA